MSNPAKSARAARLEAFESIEGLRDITDTRPLPGIEAAIDRAVDPCDDFYQFACGSWLDSFELPELQLRLLQLRAERLEALARRRRRRCSEQECSQQRSHPQDLPGSPRHSHQSMTVHGP